MCMKQQSKMNQVSSVKSTSLTYISQYLVAAMNNSSKVFEIIYLMQSRSIMKLQKFTLSKSTKHCLNTYYSRNTA